MDPVGSHSHVNIIRVIWQSGRRAVHQGLTCCSPSTCSPCGQGITWDWIQFGSLNLPFIQVFCCFDLLTPSEVWGTADIYASV